MKNKIEMQKKLGYFKVLQDQANQAQYLDKLGKLDREISFKKA